MNIFLARIKWFYLKKCYLILKNIKNIKLIIINNNKKAKKILKIAFIVENLETAFRDWTKRQKDQIDVAIDIRSTNTIDIDEL